MNPEKENFEIQKELAIKSESNTVDEYLHNPNTRVDSLNERDNQLGTPMDKDCIGAVVIPAYNEAKDISKTLDALNMQSFSRESGLSIKNFEVIIVENNSTDNTGEIVKKWITEHKDKTELKVYLLQEKIGLEERGVGAARKIGADLSILRSTKRDEASNKDFYLLALDADNPKIPTDHLEKYVREFRKKNAKILSGILTLDAEDFHNSPLLSDIIKVMNAYVNSMREYAGVNSESMETQSVSGFNHGIERDWYVKTGGYPRLKTGEDVWMGEQTKKLGGKINTVDSKIAINPRRIIFDPKAYFSNDAYEEDVFEGSNIPVRENVQADEGNFKNDIHLFLNSWFDGIAVNTSKVFNVSVQEMIKRNREWISEYVKAHGLRPEIIPDNSLFWIGHGKDTIFRRNLSLEKRREKIDEGISEVSTLIGDMNSAFIFGLSADYLRFKDIEPPSMPRVAIEKKDIENFRREMRSKGYALFDVGTWNGKKMGFCKRVGEEENLLGRETLVFIKIDPNDIPIFEESYLPLFGVSIYEAMQEGLKFSNRNKYLTKGTYRTVDILGKRIKLPEDIVLLTNVSNSQKDLRRLQIMFNQLDAVEKQRYREYLLGRLHTYTSLIEETIVQDLSIKENYEIAFNIINTVSDDLGNKEQQERRNLAKNVIIDLLVRVRNGKDLHNEVLGLVISFEIPEFLKPELVNIALK
jgi:glycosyltransferase involved in cell wall biosynthesis